RLGDAVLRAACSCPTVHYGRGVMRPRLGRCAKFSPPLSGTAPPPRAGVPPMTEAFAERLARRGSRPTLHVEEGPPSERHVLDWLAASLLLEEDWDNLTAEVRADLLGSPNRETLLAGLIKHGLL